MAAEKILVVDDEPAVSDLLKELLEETGYSVFVAQDGIEGLSAFFCHGPDLAILDVMMPKMDGWELCSRIRKVSEIPIMMLSAKTQETDKIRGFASGADEYLDKPIGNKELVARVEAVLRRARMNNVGQKVEETLDATLDALTSVMEARDAYTSSHQRRVAHLVSAIASEMRLPKHQVDGVKAAGLVHDVGKIAIPSEILSVPRRLNANEFNLIKAHPQTGYDILKTIPFPWPIAEIVLQHHERLDGSGYPAGLSDGDILLEAKLVSVADVIEARSSHRPYRPARGIEEALKEIIEKRGILYDLDVVDACLRLFAERGFKLN